MRTHTCGELRLLDVKKSVILCGWVDSIRPHGGITFANLRDRYGLTQIVFDESLLDKAKELKNESVIKIKGIVRKRPEGIVNKNISTGNIEIHATSLEILNKSDVLPLDMSGKIESTEETRLKYRYLDLRQKDHMAKLVFRHQVMMSVHEFMSHNNFIYVETPMLVKTTPEGARDFIVPSRLHTGKVYSLPQSPQLYKQISMVAGVDRYYQFARCLRDEDLRQDRQPEHTQLDIEMSFVEKEDIFELVEHLMRYVFEKILDVKIPIPFPRLTYHEAMDKYGIDKPDLRFGLELVNLTDVVKKSDFNVFKQAELVKAIIIPKTFSRKETDKLTELVKIYQAKGLAYMKYENNIFDAGISKFLSDGIKNEIKELTKIENHSTIFFVADNFKITNDSLAALRNHFGKELMLYNKKEFKFAWVTDFPMFEWSEEEKRWEAMHHMFTMPKKEYLDNLEEDPSKVLGDLYDLTLNGVELASGSIRINVPEIQERVMKLVNFSKEEAEQKFGFLLEAFKYGAPPHGGTGIGFDRMVAVMLGINDIREVIAYPKNKAMECPMDGSPSEADQQQLDELHIKFTKKE